MKPTREQLDALARAIAATRPDELDCEQVLDLVAAYAETCRRSEPTPPELEAIRHHLELCPECREEFDALLKLCQDSESAE